MSLSSWARHWSKVRVMVSDAQVMAGELLNWSIHEGLISCCPRRLAAAHELVHGGRAASDYGGL